MKRGPFADRARFFPFGLNLECSAFVVCRAAAGIGVVMSTRALRSVVVPRQIDQRAADLHDGQTEKCSRRVRFHDTQGPVQPNEGRLKNVVSFFPTPDMRVSGQHSTRDGVQPRGRVDNQFVECGLVIRGDSVQQAANLRGCFRVVVS